MSTEVAETRRRLKPTNMTPHYQARDEQEGFSFGFQAGSFIWTSAIGPRNERGEIIGEGDFEAQARKCLENVEAILRDAGGSRDDVVNITIYVREPADRATYQGVQKEFFKQPYPALTVVVGTVRPAFLIQIAAVAVLRS